MKFALINGQRQEAQPNIIGECPACGRPVIAKCGEIKIWHWAHKGRRTCDPWWESETEWHRSWKAHFPASWQEVVHHADSGEKHIADVKTEQGWVLEFQHSRIKPEERRSRDAFYKKLVWVVDGTRRKTDGARFLSAWNAGMSVDQNSWIRQVPACKCVLLREWVGGPSQVFLDFGGDQVLWWLLAGSPDGPAYIARFVRSEFIDIHRGGAAEKAHAFEQFVMSLGDLVSQYESYLRGQALNQARPRSAQGVRPWPVRGSRRL